MSDVLSSDGPKCVQCGWRHATGLSAMACDERHGTPTPGLTVEERCKLLDQRGREPVEGSQ